MAPVVHEVTLKNVPMNKNPLKHDEGVEDEVEIEDVEDIEQEEELQAEATEIPPIDPVLSQQIMSSLKALAGPGMIPPTQAHSNPLVAKTMTMTG